MLQGITTINFWAADVAAAKKWYAELLGIEPYFERPNPDGSLAYIEFRIGHYQHELGIIDRRYAPAGSAAGPAGAIVYWHIDDLPAAFDRLLSMGAQTHEPPTKRGEGFITASVIDPFANILGIMYNQHYREVLGATKPA